MKEVTVEEVEKFLGIELLHYQKVMMRYFLNQEKPIAITMVPNHGRTYLRTLANTANSILGNKKEESDERSNRKI